MKKNCKLLLVLLLILLILPAGAGCRPSAPGDADTHPVLLQNIDDQDYRWTYSIEDQAVLDFVSEEILEDHEPGPLGQYREFLFRPLKPGTTAVYFDYAKAGDDDTLYDYTVTLEVSDDFSVSTVSESGSYLALQKFLTMGEKKLGLEKSFGEYRLMFNDDVVNVGDDECAWLVVWDGDEIAASYAISNSSDQIYANEDGERVPIN